MLNTKSWYTLPSTEITQIDIPNFKLIKAESEKLNLKSFTAAPMLKYNVIL